MRKKPLLIAVASAAALAVSVPVVATAANGTPAPTSGTTQASPTPRPAATPTSAGSAPATPVASPTPVNDHYAVRPLTRVRAKTPAGTDDELSDYVASRADRLRFIAYLLCGDWHEADDVDHLMLRHADLLEPGLSRAARGA